MGTFVSIYNVRRREKEIQNRKQVNIEYIIRCGEKPEVYNSFKNNIKNKHAKFSVMRVSQRNSPKS